MTGASDAKRRFFEIYARSYAKCFSPDMTCRRKVIRAHSIPNARVLEALQERGHVTAVRMRFRGGEPSPEFVSVGRNDATTFRGLCSDHDREIFGVMDAGEIDLASDRDRFLLAYRAVLKEFYEKARKAVAFTEATRDVIGPDSTLTDPAVHVFAHAIEDGWSFFAVKSEYDLLFLSGRFAEVRTEVRVLDCAPPVLAASSLFGPIADVVIPGDPVASRRCMTVNVLPHGQATALVFTWLPAHAEFADSKLKCLRSLRKCERRRYWVARSLSE